MNYTQKDYEDDLVNPEVPHVKSKERFEAFYEQLGRGEVQKAQQYVAFRADWIQPQGEIIELGCHVGFNLIRYARMGYKITGVDISSTLLEEANRRRLSEDRDVCERITLIKSWIEDLNLDKKFDSIILTETLEHVIDPLPIMEKAKSLLKPDGQLFITTPSFKWGNNSHVRGISLPEITELVNKVGMQIVHVEPIQDVTAVIAKL